MEGEGCIQDSTHLFILGILVKMDYQYSCHWEQLNLLFKCTLIWWSTWVYSWFDKGNSKLLNTLPIKMYYMIICYLDIKRLECNWAKEKRRKNKNKLPSHLSTYNTLQNGGVWQGRPWINQSKRSWLQVFKILKRKYQWAR